MDPYLWKKSELEDADKKDVRLYNWGEERICAEEGESISIV